MGAGSRIMKCEITDDFIGIFDGYFSDDLCDRYVAYFKDLERLNLVYPRPDKKLTKNDTSVGLMSHFVPNKGQTEQFSMSYINGEFVDIFWNSVYPKYVEKYSILGEVSQHRILDMNLQRTRPGEAYHVWHCEGDSIERRDRLIVFQLYLTDIKDGGETEFVYQKTRFSPIKDRLLIWPSSWTHVHRGNMPLKEDKYIVTGWLEYTL